MEHRTDIRWNQRPIVMESAGLRSAAIAALIARVIQQAGVQLEQGETITVNERSIRVHRLPVRHHLGPKGLQER